MRPRRTLSILHVDPEQGLGGGETQVLGLVRALADAEQRQAVAADPAGRLAGEVRASGVALRPLRIRHHLDLVAGRRLSGLLAREAYDIVHFHTARAHAMSVFLGRGTRVRRIVTRRMDYPLRGGPYARWLYNSAVDAVVAISHGVETVLRESGVRPAQIHVVPSGVDVARFGDLEHLREPERARLGLGADDVLVLVAAALEERKGHGVLLDAAARLGDLPLTIVCAGAGTLAGVLARRCTALGLDGRIRFLGAVDDVRGLLAAADVVALPSLREGLGVAALEALAAGRPVVASRVGGLPEVIGDDVTGLLVPPGDAAALAAALARLARDPARARALGAAGRARAHARFSMERMAAATLRIYQRLVASDDDGRATA